MLSKVNKLNIDYGTYQIKEYIKSNSFEVIQDNLYDSLIIKNNDTVIIFNYMNKKKYNYNRIQIYFNDYIFSKQIDSFNQNNILNANKIRKYVIEKLKRYKTKNILGIGGEYYIYFVCVNYNKYIGISNHKSIIEDAQYNASFSENYLVDYDNINTYPLLTDNYTILLNVFNITEKIIEYISKLNFNKLIIIACNLADKKLKLLIKNFTICRFKHFLNVKSWITILICKKLKKINPKHFNIQIDTHN
jgi:hypothetical protein